MCSWLKDVDYLATNPWAAVNLKPLRSKAGPTLGTVDVGRALDRDLIERIWSLCDRWEEAGGWNAGLARQRFAFLFGYLTGTRLAELVSMVIGDIRIREDAGKCGAGTQWWIEVVGKGSKKRAIPLAGDAVGELQRYLDYRRLPTDPRQLPPSLPLLPALLATGKRAQAGPEFRPLSSSTLYRLLKQFFHRAAKAIEDVDPIAARRLRLASTHWLRHSHGSHADAAGVSLETIRRNLGHSSLQTTSAYIHAEDDRRWRETRRLGRT